MLLLLLSTTFDGPLLLVLAGWSTFSVPCCYSVVNPQRCFPGIAMCTCGIGSMDLLNCCTGHVLRLYCLLVHQAGGACAHM